MERVGTRRLRQELPALLERVRAGETIEVTDRGVPAARLVSIDESEDLVDRLIRTGQATAPSRPLYPLPRPAKAVFMTGTEALELSARSDDDPGRCHWART